MSLDAAITRHELSGPVRGLPVVPPCREPKVLESTCAGALPAPDSMPNFMN